MAVESQSSGGLRGIHVLFGFLAFFGVVFAVNGVFLYEAISTYTGVVSKQPYRKGLAYNERIAADEQQKKLGWAVETRFERATGRLLATIQDRRGSPVTGLKLAGMMGRPSTAEFDKHVVLRERESGVYEAQMGSRPSGTWMVELKAEKGDGHVVYRLRRRLWLKP